jgi:lipoprotein-anchoring transpeptidase ErfK/SrfK
MALPPAFRRRMRKSLLATTSALLVMVLLSACNGNPQTQQQANQYKADLDQALSQAQSIGVPDSMLQPIRQQEVQLSQTKAPLSLFSDQNVTDYYANLARRYQVLNVQVRGLISQATQQFDYQATLNLQDLASILSKRQAQGFVEAKTFADQLKQYQNLMAQAQYPKDYLQIIKGARSTMQSLRLMGSTYDNLTALHLTIRQLQSSHLDVTALQQEEQYDLQLFRSANVPERFVQLDDLINTQLGETVAFSAQAIPYVGAAKLNQLSSEIATLKQYAQDTSAFQKRLNADQTALDQARMMGDFLKVSSQIDNDVAAIQLPLVQSQANYLLKQFHREVTNWGSTHQYHDSYDNTSYPLDYEYDQQEGFGSDADVAVQTAQTLDDYQAAINTINDDMTNLKAMEADYNDKTPWDQQHATDKQLMQYYNATTGQVIVVSLVEQTLRLYQDGKLVKAFLITSGQFAKPSPPGFWHIFLRQSPTVFKSGELKGSAFWYPDTKINYAMEYHDDGYYFHDSWWRYYYGPGTNFPHYDPGGEEFAGTGSHGCINMQQDQAAWLYANTGYGTAVIMY